MPLWAYHEIFMCLHMDFYSKNIDDEIKDDLLKAVNAIKTVKYGDDEE